MDTNEKRLHAIGHAIAIGRDSMGISQTQLADALGYTNHAYLSRVECGKQAPSLDMVFKVADIIGKPVNYFFTDI